MSRRVALLLQELVWLLASDRSVSLGRVALLSQPRRPGPDHAASSGRTFRR